MGSEQESNDSARRIAMLRRALNAAASRMPRHALRARSRFLLARILEMLDDEAKEKSI
jgi:hypothetical protein